MSPFEAQRRSILAGKGPVIAFVVAVLLVVAIASGAFGAFTSGSTRGVQG